MNVNYLVTKLTHIMTVKLDSVKLLICFLLLSASAIAQEDELSAPLIFGVNESPPLSYYAGRPSE